MIEMTPRKAEIHEQHQLRVDTNYRVVQGYGYNCVKDDIENEIPMEYVAKKVDLTDYHVKFLGTYNITIAGMPIKNAVIVEVYFTPKSNLDVDGNRIVKIYVYIYH